MRREHEAAMARLLAQGTAPTPVRRDDTYRWQLRRLG